MNLLSLHYVVLSIPNHTLCLKVYFIYYYNYTNFVLVNICWYIFLPFMINFCLFVLSSESYKLHTSRFLNPICQSLPFNLWIKSIYIYYNYFYIFGLIYIILIFHLSYCFFLLNPFPSNLTRILAHYHNSLVFPPSQSQLCWYI